MNAINSKYIKNLVEILKSKTVKDSFLVLSGNILSKGIGFLFTIILARYLGVNKFGDFSIAVSVMALISQFADMGITTGFIRYASLYIHENKIKAAALAKVTLQLKIGVSVLLLIIGYITSPYIASVILKDSSLTLLLRLSFIGAFGNALYSYGEALLRSYEYFKRTFLCDLTMNISKFVVLLIILYLGIVNINNSFMIIVCIPFVAALLNSVLLPKELINIDYDKKTQKEVMLELFHFSKWVMLSSFAVMMITKLDVFMLKSMSTSLQVGYYSGAEKFAMFFPVITSAITSVLLPKISKIKSKQELKKFIKKTTMLTSIMVIPLFTLLYLAKYLIVFLLGISYSPSITIFQILLLSYIFEIVFNPISLVIYNLNKNHILVILNFIQLIMAYLLNLILIPRFNAVGSSITTLLIRIIGFIFVGASVYVYLKEGGDNYS